MEKPHIAFVGAGNMASSIIGGLVANGHPPSKIHASDPYPPSLDKLKEVAAVNVSDTNAAAVEGADVIILAVKPQVMAEAVESIAGAAKAAGALTLSIAAGVTIESMQQRLGDQAAVVRCMPNTPALLGCGASALYANPQTNPLQKSFAEAILSAVGNISWVSTESELDAITALSGSGPAYFFLFMEAMIDAGVNLGLPRETATSMAMQTAYGSARMAMESEVDLVELRRRVTSPGGTTERAIESFENSDIRGTVQQAMNAAAERAAEMAREMG